MNDRSRREGIHVLLVDDDFDHRDDMRAVLQEDGYRVDVADDGLDAVRKSAALQPDLILMDLQLPVMDGWEAIREIRRRAGGSKQTPYVIAISGFTDASARQKAFEAGCNEYVVKSFDVRAAVRAYAWRIGR
jgi:CheY-like chemotaxis protein